MKVGVFIFLTLFIASVHNEALQLFTVSISPTSIVKPNGSVRGGTIIYISGLGFNTNPAGNQIFIGPYPCKIPADGATSTSLACVTSDTNQNSAILNLPIIVFSNGQKQNLTNEQGSYSYTTDRTPYLYELYPAADIAGTRVHFYGIHRISYVGDGARDMGDVISMLIGDTQCGRFDIVQSNISANSLDTISCNQASIQQAGKYKASQYLKPGYSNPTFKLRRTSHLNEEFHYTVLPSITDVSPHSGSVAGQQLTISGTGFSTNSSDLKVTVDGNICSVTQSSINQIICDLPSKNSLLSSILPTNSANQINGYHSGAGLRYRRFDLSSGSYSTTTFVTALKNNMFNSLLVQQSVKAQIKSGNYFGANFGQAFQGYFVAPKTGTYTFRGMGDDGFAVYLTATFGSAQPSSNPLIFSNNVQNYNNFYTYHYPTAEASVNLQEGKSYYIQVYHVNYGGAGYLKVEVEVPNQDTTLFWQTHAVHRLTLNYTNDPQILQFRQTGGLSGSINLTTSIRQIGKPPLVQFAVIPYDATINQFLTALKQLSAFSTYSISGERYTLDANGNMAINDNQTYTYVWKIYIKLLRPTSVSNLVITPRFISYTGVESFQQVTVQPHGPLISGSYGLTIGGLSVMNAGTNFLRFNLGPSDLQNSLRAIKGFENIQVQLLTSSSMAGYGSTWLISYIGYNGIVPPLITNNQELTGGAPGTKPYLLFEQIRPYRSNLLYSPIDYHLLRTASSTINIQVSVNDIPSVCKGDCSYSFIINSPLLTSASINKAILTLSLTDPSAIGYNLNDVTVVLNNQPCTIINLADPIDRFTCSLPINVDDTPVMPSGTYPVVVNVKQVGKVAHAPAVNPFSFPLILTNLNQLNGGQNGGYDLILTGTGFPTNINQAKITICGQQATIKQIYNINATIIVPSCANLGSTPVTISYGVVNSNSLNFQYIAPAPPAYIFSVSPQSHNPTLKGIMQITGIGFSNGIIRVDLANSSGKIYGMRIIRSNDTYIKVGIPGGLAGNYKVEVNLIGIGQAMPNTTGINRFTYQLIINEVVPSSGSYYGGTLINIKGINFSNKKDETLVFIGNQINWMCTVQNITTTNIFCRTPPISQYYNISHPQSVVLTNRLMADNTCGTGPCQFNYLSEADSPKLSTISHNIISSSTVITLTGNNFNLGPPVIVLTNKQTSLITLVTPTSTTSTSVQFLAPNLQSGQYNVKIRVDPIGQSNGLLLNINAVLSSSSTVISTQGGNVALTGFGLSNRWPNDNFILRITKSNNFIQPEVISSTPGVFVVKLPTSKSGQVFKISLNSPLNNQLIYQVTSNTLSTPIISLTTSSSTNPGLINFSFTQSNLLSSSPSYVLIYSTYNPVQTYNFSLIAGSTQGLIQFSATLTGGKYRFSFYYNNIGWGVCNSQFSVVISAPTFSAFQSSYNGGSFTLSAIGLSKSGTISINGLKTQLTSVDGIRATAIIPPFVTQYTLSQLNHASAHKIIRNQFTIISDSQGTQQNAFDTIHGTSYSSTSNGACFIGIDVGTGLNFVLSRIRFFPYNRWIIIAQYMLGAKIQASNDNSAWLQIAEIDSTVHSGWNILKFDNKPTYRYYRFSHNQTSNCRLSQLQFEGIIQANVNINNLATNFMSMVYEDGANMFTFANSIQFRQDHTPIVESLSKVNGDVFGGYNITITGRYLNFDTPNIIIDGIQCIVRTSSTSSIECTVGERLNLPSSNSFVVKIGKMNAIIRKSFQYVLRWSDIRTWGTDLFPVAGDLVHVPSGMHLLVDQSTPVLEGILVENGTITFSDEVDMVVSATFISVIGGRFVAGTQAKPYSKKLTFIMNGNYYGPQMPMFGNKVIGCLECFISIHGQVRSKTWTLLESTILKSVSSFTVRENVDWRVGQYIVVASTSHDHNQAEKRMITAISGRYITVDKPFNYQHFAGIQNYGSDHIQMRAQVGLLTRNIKIMGDDTSERESYGSHLMMAGSAENGLVGQIAYTQFTKCGQPRIIGRYCIHFHMNGDVAQSFARGNAVHDSMARVITLHGVHYLRVQKNVGYNVRGHNYFIEDGIETQNLLQYNLAISSRQSFTMLQTDMSVASFWITNPTNHFRYNHAAGSDFYGFWYEIKSNPDGPSANPDVCPTGNPLGQSHSNIAHSNKRFGLRIFKYAPRTYPCSGLHIQHKSDPFSINPGIIGTFSNYTLYKNGQAGLLAQQTAYLVFSKFKLAQNNYAGAAFWQTYYSKQLTTLEDSVIIGQTTSNSPHNVNGASGIVTPRLGNIRINNIRFYNYPQSTYSISTCANCSDLLLFTNTAQQIYISNITFTNVLGYKLFMNGAKKQILYDMDGSFTTTNYDGVQRQSAAIVRRYKHLADDSACSPPTSTMAWDDTIACDHTVKIVRVTFNQISPDGMFASSPLKIQQINSLNETAAENSIAFTQIYSVYGQMQPMISSKKTYAMPYIAGRIYNIWWLTGLDFDSLKMTSSNYFKDTDPGIVFKFNYTNNRQLYEIGAIRPGEPLDPSNLFIREDNYINPDNCTNGQYYHDNTAGQRVLGICASAKNRTLFEIIDVKAIYCRYLCPAPPGQFIKQSFVRYWSNASQWPEGRLPMAGQNVTVNGNWTIIMDIDPAQCQFMTIDGDVIIEDLNDRNIHCKFIWIRAGSLKAGSASSPFTHKINITLYGNRNDSGYVIDDSLVGNKLFVITGKLQLYGVSPSTVASRLISTIKPGETMLRVQSTAGWAIGDQLVIAPSFSSSIQYERVAITSINGNQVMFTPALKYTHYGAAGITISNSIGTLDTRAVVGHVTRNIKFLSGDDIGWGYSVFVYQIWEGTDSRSGTAIFNSVQFILGGQYDTQKASLVLSNNQDYAAVKTIIDKSSFSFCRSYCIYANYYNNAQIKNNVLYQARKFQLKLFKVSNMLVDKNIMIGAIKRSTLLIKEPIACLELLQTDVSVDNTYITNNICQGTFNGYNLPLVPCSVIDQGYFANNLVGSAAQVGFLLYKMGYDRCVGFSGVRAYACKIGQISNSEGTNTLRLSNYIIADTFRGVSLRFGLEGTDNSGYLSDSYFIQISRPQCTQCYGAGKISCSGGSAIRMLSHTINGQSYPRSFDSGFDVVCRHTTFDSKVFITNVKFDGYRQSYPQTHLNQCSKNVVFRTHPSNPDFIGGHHLWDSQCTNCDFDAFAYFDPPLLSEIGWFGGCGTMVCTGKNNYFIQDHTGNFFPSKGILLANNSWIGQNTDGCTFNAILNGYYCIRSDFATLVYESIAPDYNTRIMWPVNLTFQGSRYTTITNGYKQWQWTGKEPLNKRLARFVSVIQLHQRYNMTFASNPPDDMRLQIQKKTPNGNASDWIVVKLHYPFPNSIEVSVRNQVVRPISLLDNYGEAPLDTSLCGSNKYFYKNYTIHFVITGNCIVRVRLTNSIQLTLRFSMNINDFFNTNGPTRLIDRIAAVFQIADQSRIKIVSVYSGSVFIVVSITSDAPNDDNTVNADRQQGLKNITELQKQIHEKHINGTLNQQFSEFGTLLTLSSVVLPIVPVQQKQAQQTNITIIIIFSVFGGLLLIVGGIILFRNKQSNRVAVQIPQASSGLGNIGEHNEQDKKEEIQIHNITQQNISEVIFEQKNQ